MAEMTPMKKQYYQIHEQVPDCLLFFRLGDFYEMFDNDAQTASRELDLTLTTRDRGKPAEEQTPMCGVPYHSAQAYIARLIEKGYKVALCDQLEDPAASSGLVNRGVTRVITPGTVTDAAMLEEGRSNYLCAVWLKDDHGAAAFCDASTGEFCVAEFPKNAQRHISNELTRFAPREVVLCAAAVKGRVFKPILRRLGCMTEEDKGRFDPEGCAARVQERFGEPAGEDETLAAGALLAYLAETQKTQLDHIRRLDRFTEGLYMELDWSARRSLELTENLRTGEKRGSLLGVLDRTKTPMGSRLMRSWVERPLLSPVAIGRRLAAVNELFSDGIVRAELILSLNEIGDIQRLISRCVYGTANGRDLLSLSIYFLQLPRLKELLSGASSAMLRECAEMNPLSDVQRTIARCLCDEPPFSVHDGGLIRPGFNEEIDRLRAVRDHGTEMVAALETRERERLGVKKLKVGYNRVFGYYIEIPRSAGEIELPAEYIRKQTTANAERYFTPELKELENELLTAREKVNELEFDLFSQLRKAVADQVVRMQATAARVAELDALCALAEVAFRNNYCMPQVDLSRTIDIRDGRHPVVEAMQRDTLFVPNDTLLNDSSDRVAIVTGPNMAGKSTYMRQTALIVLMAQIGSFVPARSATIGVADRVFTRIGASDDLSSGQSTFMVEMTEMANILSGATPASLLILDEIGRGTSTYDGMAIARAMLEHCKELGARTMFATHYHELSALEGQIDGVKNYNITAKKQNGTLVFLRKIVPGSADDSYGIEVAKLAGVPDSVIRKANEYLRELESEKPIAPAAAPQSDQMTLMDMAGSALADELRSLSIETMTPIEALNTLYQMKRKYTS